MLGDPSLTVAGLADRLAIKVDAVRIALNELADLALIRLNDTGDSAHVMRPGVGLTALLSKIENDVAVRQRQIEATRSAIAAITAVHDANSGVEETRRIGGLESVRERLVELAERARTECLSFTPGAAQTADTIEAEKPLNQLALARGVTIRNVYQESVRNDPATLAHATWMADLGGHSRTVPTLPMRMIIVDREIALVPINPIVPAEGALEVRSPGLVAGFIALFYQVWESGTPFGEQPTLDDHGLTSQERALIRMLAAGYTDESAARKLGISVRSVQRMTAVLTERLDAASRFQAGVEATRHGWV
jgi:DNA-binding CsgD family transcriptional regulator